MRMLNSRVVPVVVILLLLSSVVPKYEVEKLEDVPTVKQIPANLETYNLFLGEASDSGGDGSITTMEPEGNQEESSILSGVDFRSDDLISDLTLYGQGLSLIHI